MFLIVRSAFALRERSAEDSEEQAEPWSGSGLAGNAASERQLSANCEFRQ